MLVTASGLGFYNLSVLLAALISERGISTAAASAAPSLFFFTSGISGLLIATLIDRYDVRYTMVVGALICALALLLIGRATEIWQLYAAFVLFGLGFSATSLLPSTTLATRWFHRRRSLAMAIVMTGLSVGGMCLTPLSAWLIATLQLPQATLWLSLLYLAGIIPVTLWLIRSYPATMGLLPDGDSAGQQQSVQINPSFTFQQAWRTGYFFGLTISYLFILMSQVGAIAHLFKLVEGRVDGFLAAIALSLMAGCSMAARLLGGWLSATVSLRSYALMMMVLQALGLAFLALADGYLSIILAVITFGISIGNILMLMPLLLAEAFGVRYFSRIYSVSQLIVTLGVATGPFLIGIVHDISHGYQAAFLVAAGCSLLAACILLLTKRSANLKQN